MLSADAISDSQAKLIMELVDLNYFYENSDHSKIKVLSHRAELIDLLNADSNQPRIEICIEDFRSWKRKDFVNIANEIRIESVFSILLPDEYPMEFWREIQAVLGHKLKYIPVPFVRGRNDELNRQKSILIAYESNRHDSKKSYFTPENDIKASMLRHALQQFEMNTGWIIRLVDLNSVAYDKKLKFIDRVLPEAGAICVCNCNPLWVSTISEMHSRVILTAEQYIQTSFLRTIGLKRFEILNCFGDNSRLRSIVRDCGRLVNLLERFDFLADDEAENSWKTPMRKKTRTWIDVSDEAQYHLEMNWVPQHYWGFLWLGVKAEKEQLESGPIKKIWRSKFSAFLDETEQVGWIRAFEWACFGISGSYLLAKELAGNSFDRTKSIHMGVYRGLFREFAHGWRKSYLKWAVTDMEAGKLNLSELSWLAAIYGGIGNFDKAFDSLESGCSAVPFIHAAFNRAYREAIFLKNGETCWSEAAMNLPETGIVLDSVGQIPAQEITHYLLHVQTIAALYKNNLPLVLRLIDDARKQFGTNQVDYAILAIHAWLTGRNDAAEELLSMEHPSDRKLHPIQVGFLASAHAIFGEVGIAVNLFNALEKKKDNAFTTFFNPSIRWALLCIAFKAPGNDSLSQRFETAGRNLHPYGDLLVEHRGRVEVRTSVDLPTFCAPDLKLSYQAEIIADQPS